MQSLIRLKICGTINYSDQPLSRLVLQLEWTFIEEIKPLNYDSEQTREENF